MDRTYQFFKKLAIPYYPSGDDNEGFEIYTLDEKTVADYCNMSILEVSELDLIEFLCYRRDAVIYKLQQTEEGQKYLDNAYRLTLTSPDREGLRERFGTKKVEK